MDKLPSSHFNFIKELDFRAITTENSDTSMMEYVEWIASR